jgi:hypothetical protein
LLPTDELKLPRALISYWNILMMLSWGTSALIRHYLHTVDLYSFSLPAKRCCSCCFTHCLHIVMLSGDWNNWSSYPVYDPWWQDRVVEEWPLRSVFTLETRRHAWLYLRFNACLMT